jgi:hypothetical protein
MSFENVVFFGALQRVLAELERGAVRGTDEALAGGNLGTRSMDIMVWNRVTSR